MKFFIPHSNDESEAISVYQGIKSFAETQTSWTISGRRIYSISYRHEGKKYTATVGERENRVGEEVIAILDSVTYLVCTPNRGVIRGEPILVGKAEATIVEDFSE